ncbi:MAG: cellulase family glycosylhydrolase [Clostridia bacterium]|nr:cellulase family glycosylhydrolase [Clostridia bacterium]
MLHYGFNFLWMYACNQWNPLPKEPDLRELDFIAEEGFNFVRIPVDYSFWTKDHDYTHPNEDILAYLDRYIDACRERGLHACLNLHRAPGYCINWPEREIHNLWRDEEAQEGFRFLWEYFAKKYKGISSKELSFDLVNEPANIPPSHPCTRDDHQKVIRSTIAAIRAIDPDREIVIDGFDGGGSALPELWDAGVIHSGRGYEPFSVSHYKAEWVRGEREWQMPSWPLEENGEVKDIDWIRRYYQPWKDVEAKGVQVHIGEFGCYNKIPNPIALAWLADLMKVFKENRWGYSLWNFRGAFGIADHGRPDTKWEDYKGIRIDREMLEIYKSGMITE